MPKWIIPKEAAEEIVAKGTQNTGKSVQTFARAPVESEPQVALFLNQSTWSNKQTRAVIVDANGTATSGAVDVYAPTATSDANLPSTYFHAALIEGRWELLAGVENTFVARPMRLQSAWTRNNDNLWVATACPIISDGGSVDLTTVVNVCCPTAVVKPEGEPLSWRFWAVFRNGRWESIQHYVYIPEYVSGSYASVGAYSPELGGRPISCLGVHAARIRGDSYAASNGDFYLSPDFFEWSSRELDAVGGKEATLKTHSVQVVTGVDFEHGTVTTATLRIPGI